MSRAVTRLTTAGLAGLVTVFLTAAPAFADNPLGPAEGHDPGEGLGTVEALLLYAVLPVAIALGTFALVMLPGAKANRYRPNKPWTAPPVWFGGPADPVAAVESAELGDVVRGGASGNW